MEQDYLNIQYRSDSSESSYKTAVAAPSGVVDSALDLFQKLLAFQSVDTLMQATTLMTNHLRSPKMEKNPGRRQAVTYNVVEALRCSLAVGERSAGRKAKDNISNAGVLSNIRTLLQVSNDG